MANGIGTQDPTIRYASCTLNAHLHTSSTRHFQVMAGDKSQWKLRRSSDPILNENSGTAEGDNRSSINVQRNNPENLTERPTQRDKGGSCQCIIS